MPSNGSSNAGVTVPAGADDFTRIRGVSPKIAHRLYDAGILTYAKLAAMTPEEIVARIGMSGGVSAEGIAKRDWAGQARKLAPQTEPAAETSQSRADFAVKLQLNPDNTVSQTHVMHMQSGEEEMWDGWAEERMNSFFIQRARLTVAAPVTEEESSVEASSLMEVSIAPTPENAVEPAPVKDEENVSHFRTETPPATEPGAAAPRHLDVPHSLEVLPENQSFSSHLLRHGQAFNVRLSLDLSTLEHEQPGSFAYSATVYAKSLESRQPQALGESIGTVEASGRVSLDIPALNLAQGAYRLGARVTLGHGKSVDVNPQFTTYVEGGVLQVC